MTTDAAALREEIVAKPAMYYRVTRLIMATVLIAYGVWSIRDGFFKWPEEARAAEAMRETPPHNHLSILINQALGVALPPLGLLMLIWGLYNSRGSYRLSGTTLHVPGHPPIDLSHIIKVDQSRWQRKGIAYLEYDDSASGKRGTMKLDDYVYERSPTDAIYDRIVAQFVPEQESAADAEESSPSDQDEKS